MTRRHPHIANLDEIPVVDGPHGRFAPRERYLADATGGKQLGCSYVELPPGKTAWPFHYHCANEEAMFVLEGYGLLRIGAARVEIRAGDYIALPAGEACAHQTINTSDTPLRYLCFSTRIDTEVVVYPDSNKIGARHGQNDLRALFRREDQVDYWLREEE